MIENYRQKLSEIISRRLQENISGYIIIATKVLHIHTSNFILNTIHDRCF